jgi:hypothetical protein
MFATVREGTFDPEQRRQGQAQLEEFAARRARQPGYAGGVTVDAGGGHTFTVTLWESEARAKAARAVLEPEAQRLLAPLRTPPPRVIGRGPVLRSDLADLYETGTHRGQPLRQPGGRGAGAPAPRPPRPSLCPGSGARLGRARPPVCPGLRVS